MSYNELIRKKTQFLSVTLLISIVLRGIVNAFFIDVKLVGAMVILGLIISIIVQIVGKFCPPNVTMFFMVALLTILSILCMVVFPTTTNFLMFFLAIFMIVIYEDFWPILLQCIASSACMIFFYFKYQSYLEKTWSVDALAMCIVYILSALLVYGGLCRMTQNQFRTLNEKMEESEMAKKQADDLLEEMAKTIVSLHEVSDQISISIKESENISSEINNASKEVVENASLEVDAAGQIHVMVEDGVNKIYQVSESSIAMTKISRKTSELIDDGSNKINTLTSEMALLDTGMKNITESITELSEETMQIIEILGTLDSITKQTSLLALNASIEAARAGEHGKGFAVVANDVRELSEDSAKFTNKIHDILNEISNKTGKTKEQIEENQESVLECVNHAKKVDESFSVIFKNTKEVYDRAKDVEKDAEILKDALDTTLDHANNISQSVETTSDTMEAMSNNIEKLYDSVSTIDSSYGDLKILTKSLSDIVGGDVDINNYMNIETNSD